MKFARARPDVQAGERFAAVCAVVSIFTDLRIRRYRRREIGPVPPWVNYWRLFRPDFYTPESQSLRRLAAAATIVGSGLLFACVTLIFLWRPQHDADACWFTRGMPAASPPAQGTLSQH